MRPKGRPTKCTPELTAAICAWLEKGSSYAVAAECEGISERAFHEWVQWGNEGKEPYVHFAQAVKRARAASEQRVLTEIRDAYTSGPMPTQDWRARDRWLQLTNPERYSPTLLIKAKVEAELEEVLSKLREGLDQETFGRVLAILAGNDVACETGASDDRESEDGSE